ncbi:MAG TPA: polyphosphate kinase 1 [Pyrinomonadaceae bacterium]|nr:polyphosphate kinase 1 [Pyrinomonadaceae bacterium]
MTQNIRQIYQTEETNAEFLLPQQFSFSPEYLFNRELSLIEFFRRVLEEGIDSSQPLLERLKFLTILSSNLDEFFMIRVSSLKEKFVEKLSPDGLTPAEQLTEIKTRVTEIIDLQMACLREEILPELATQGIIIATYESLNKKEQSDLDEYFKQKIYPILTPQAVDPSHPFPYISGGSLNIGLVVKPKVKRRIEKAFYKYQTGDDFFVRIKIPDFVPRFIPVQKDSTKFIMAEDLIKSNIQMLIPESNPNSCHLFRITRDGDIGLREEEAEDLLQMMEENLKQRRFGDVVRIEVSKSMPRKMVEYLINSMEISNQDVYSVDGYINLCNFMELYKLDYPNLKDIPLISSRPTIFNTQDSIFDLIKKDDILLHHPYMPYDIVTDFIKEAAEDPDVLAIKMCLYRIGANSPIAPLLIKASESGKQITVLIELKARFDEENNIEWAKRFEQAGIHVVYGILGLKTHCKTTLIIRRENDELHRYLHIATGNYNPETSAFYTDLGLLTNDEELGADTTELFNFLTAYTQRKNYQKLLVAPINLRKKMIEMIETETENAKNDLPARIIAKMNRLADVEIIQALYAASNAGVEIDLIIRGICMLRPQVPGLSENIRVRSIVGRLLEHSRVYYFANGGTDNIYLGSSDWMPRNLDRRVEVLTPIKSPTLKKYLKDDFLLSYLQDNVKARELNSDGVYEKVFAEENEEQFNSQLSFQAKSNVVDLHLSH